MVIINKGSRLVDDVGILVAGQHVMIGLYIVCVWLVAHNKMQ